MFLPDKSKQHQQLTQYLREAARRRTLPGESVPAAVIALAMVLTLMMGLLLHTSALLMVVPLLAIVGLFAWQKTQVKKREPDAREKLQMEAKPVIETMLAHAESKRLHRELDQASVALLEECARYYWQVRQVFDSVFWTSESLPMQYAGLRDQALKAADSTMDELMLLYRNSLPERPKGTQPLEFVEDVVEEYVRKKPRTVDFIPTTFDPTRKIAEKLRLLAEEADRVSQEINAEMSLPSLTNPGSALDASIGELRQIRQAEEELRQNLGGLG
ncbi:MAG TPA: hypothetical protein VGE01_03225 [Fimbriimonas sp.]